jgi:hypothetical protein
MMTLDAMITLAGEHARRILIEQKHAALAPVFLFQTAAGEIGFVQPAGSIMNNAAAKDALAAKVRALMRERGAIAYSFVSEAWMATLPASEPLPANVRDRPDRVEIVYAVAFDAAGESRSGCWRMVRGPDGALTDLVDEGAFGGPDMLAGRFTNLLQARA